MHELGVVIEIVKTVEAFVASNGVTRIDTLVLQIGELSSAVPKYVEACYPAAVEGTLLEGTKLKIEILPANAICARCRKVFGLVGSGGECPRCGSEEYEALGGRELKIKEIVAR
jgi:hydrogenase nickel incorporation protein HypA/HybF